MAQSIPISLFSCHEKLLPVPEIQGFHRISKMKLFFIYYNQVVKESALAFTTIF